MDWTARDWRYKAEGGANVVFEYVGAQPIYTNHVLRTRKRWSKHGKDHHSADLKKSNLEQVELLPHDPFDFSMKVMQPLLPEYVIPGTKIDVLPERFLEELQQVLDESSSDRPQFRLKDVLETRLSHFQAVLMRDQTASPTGGLESTWTVEIKPKSGVRSYLYSSSKPYCRFCMHQIERALSKWTELSGNAPENPKISSETIDFVAASISLYCPSLLFSSDKSEIERAIRSLLPRPQNNLRVFSGGKLVFSEDVEPSMELRNFLVDELPVILAEILHSDGLLPSLQRLQELDAEIGSSAGAFEAFKLICMKHRKEDELGGAGTESLESDAELVERVLSSPSDEEEVELARKLRQFMISVTARDCSIMVTFWKSSDLDSQSGAVHTRGSIECRGRGYSYKTAVVDLDSKPLARIPHYALLEESILAAALKVGDPAMKQANKECYYNNPSR
jgi:Inositol-pentakisphosphate 2-kinase